MKVNPVSFTAKQSKAVTGKESLSAKKEVFLEKFYTKAKNSADMTDAILVPRTIFKGYLGIMTGTTLLTLGMLLNKHAKASEFLSILGVLTSLYGTYSFVRPYIIKDTKGVLTSKDVPEQQKV